MPKCQKLKCDFFFIVFQTLCKFLSANYGKMSHFVTKKNGNAIKNDIFAHCVLDWNNEDQDSCGQKIVVKSSKNSGTEVIKEEVAQDWNPPLCHSWLQGGSVIF